jgi:hypothetical protein
MKDRRERYATAALFTKKLRSIVPVMIIDDRNIRNVDAGNNGDDSNMLE